MFFTSKEKTILAHDVFDNFYTRSWFVHDVTDTDCWAQNGSTHCRVFVTFDPSLTGAEMLIHRLQGQKCEKTAVSICCFSLSRGAASCRFPFKAGL